MVIISGERQYGKTTKLVEYASMNNKTILCSNESNLKHIKAISERLNLPIPEPVVFKPSTKLKEENDSYVIDDIEGFLVNTIGRTVDVITTSSPIVNIEREGNEEDYLVNVSRKLKELGQKYKKEVDKKIVDFLKSNDQRLLFEQCVEPIIMEELNIISNKEEFRNKFSFHIIGGYSNLIIEKKPLQENFEITDNDCVYSKCSRCQIFRTDYC